MSKQHHPERGDAVEAWLLSYREAFGEKSSVWYAIDDLLDDYRETADEGRPLSPWEDDDIVVTE